jgi:hypothetical protein
VLSVLRQLLAEAPDAPVFVSDLSAAPATASGLPVGRRRSLQQAGPPLLQATVVVGGSQPTQLYQAAVQALK